MPICWAMNRDEIEYLLNNMISRKYIDAKGSIGSVSFEVQITTVGYVHLDELRRKINSNIGFCAMAFDEELLNVWDEAISPAIINSGYDALRIDTQPYNTGVVDQIKAKIRESRFLIADLTMHKHGVYWEAGFAEGLGCDVIYTCRNDEFEKRHFDVQHINTIKWNPNKLDDFMKMLTFRIKGSLGVGTNSNT